VDIDDAWEEFRRRYEDLIVSVREEKLQVEVKELQMEVTRLNGVIDAYKEFMKIN
jgi:hypothetical protein